MTDIVDSLRSHSMPGSLMHEAADEIDRLRERVAELQAQCGYTESIKTLRAALNGNSR